MGQVIGCSDESLSPRLAFTPRKSGYVMPDTIPTPANKTPLNSGTIREITRTNSGKLQTRYKLRKDTNIKVSSSTCPCNITHTVRKCNRIHSAVSMVAFFNNPQVEEEYHELVRTMLEDDEKKKQLLYDSDDDICGTCTKVHRGGECFPENKAEKRRKKSEAVQVEKMPSAIVPLKDRDLSMYTAKLTKCIK